MHPGPPDPPGAVDELLTRFRTLEKRRLQGGVKLMLWRLCAWVGNRFLRRDPPDVRSASGKALLNLGCGSKLHEGWVNGDFYRLNQLLPGAGPGPNWMLDLTRRFPCPDDRWDGVFLEHVNEHLVYSENLHVMCEVFRTLKPGGTLRVVVPSLHRYLDWERARARQPKFARYASLPEALSNLTQNHAHRSIWDPALMIELLRCVGFDDVREVDFREGADPELAQDGESHRWESLYVEASKPRDLCPAATARPVPTARPSTAA